MAFSFKYHATENYVFVHTSGVMTMQELVQLAKEALLFSREHKVKRFLVDHRDMTPNISTHDIYDLPGINRELGINDQLTTAVVYSEHSASKDDFDFYQVRSLSMGINNLRHFTDMQQAMTWLLGEPVN
ncbi:MAG: hypothetical protein ABI644_10090 [Arenimonas sp.]